METLTLTGNGDTSIGVVDPAPPDPPDSFAERRRRDERNAARQLRNAVRHVVALHLASEPTPEEARWAAYGDVERFIGAAIDEHKARCYFQQLELRL